MEIRRWIGRAILWGAAPLAGCSSTSGVDAGTPQDGAVSDRGATDTSTAPVDSGAMDRGTTDAASHPTDATSHPLDATPGDQGTLPGDGPGCECVGATDCCDGCHALPAGTACADDAAACTDDVCAAGTCIHPVRATFCLIDGICLSDGTTNPGDTCQYCDSVFSADAFRNFPDGVNCDDGDACTAVDRCSAGACAGTQPVVCAAQDLCHAAGLCDTASGTCSNPNVADNTVCDDGDPATGGETCQGGVCLGAGCTCAGVNECCDGCFPLNDGGGCTGDGLNCTTDSCSVGQCTHPAVDGFCVIDGACYASNTDDPANNCQYCHPSDSVNGWTPKPNNTACDDGNGCTTTDLCSNAVCVGSEPVQCVALDPCHDIGACDPANGLCSNPPKPDGSLCTDGNACTQSDTCQGGQCHGAQPVLCQALDQCHVPGACNQLTGACDNPTQPENTSCNDNNPATGPDLCQNGSCGGAECTCFTHDDCCDGCHPINNGGGCADDGIACTVDACQAGTCQHPLAGGQCYIGGACYPHQAANPGNQCQWCDAVTPTIWQPKPAAQPCNDGNACTQTDTCNGGGTCVGAAPVSCGPLDQCHDAGSCWPANGQCSNPPRPEGSACDDGSSGTVLDQCSAGVCTCIPAFRQSDCPIGLAFSGQFCGSFGDGCGIQVFCPPCIAVPGQVCAAMPVLWGASFVLAGRCLL